MESVTLLWWTNAEEELQTNNKLIAVATKHPVMTNDSDHRICDYSVFLNRTSRRRINEPFKSPEDGCLFVSSGFPNPATFPIVKGEFTLSDGTTLEITEDEMKKTLQYGPLEGDPELRQWLIELQRLLHDPPLLDDAGKPSSMDLLVSVGCTDGIGKVLEAVLVDGDTLLTEEFTYPCIFTTVVPIGAGTCAVQCDNKGMMPAHLEQVLSTWNETTQGRRPRLLYCIPSANNPTGVRWSLERKREVYKIARKYELLILEDDPYYFMQFNQPRVPGFLSLDTDGRVIRLDTFTKVMSPGARLGYISGPSGILERLALHMVTTSYHASNLSQIFILKVLQHMGYDGFLKHGDEVANFYKQRSEKAVKMAEKYLKGLAEWNVPDGGMFLWMHMLGVTDSSSVVSKVEKRGVLFTDGLFFTSGTKPSSYIRMSFSLNSEEELDQAVNVLAEVIREEQKLNSYSGQD